jgi:hypothetical protein
MNVTAAAVDEFGEVKAFGEHELSSALMLINMAYLHA